MLVLAVIQEKVNNPSPDDPFEPDIAMVSNSFTYSSGVCIHIWCLQVLKNDKARFLATAKEYIKK